MNSLWSFEPIDSCFFREAKPFNAGEGGYLDSQFPPPVQTLIGAFRSAVGESLGVDWLSYRRGRQPHVTEVIGSPENFAPLSFGGPYLLRDGQRLYPTPLHLLTKMDEEDRHWTLLEPGEAVACDLGKVRLPKMVGELAGGKSPDDLWLDAGDMSRVLEGGVPEGGIERSALCNGEARTGIGRDNDKRTAEDGMLYFTRHIRLHDDVAFGLAVSGIKNDISPSITRLGGEGRLAALNKLDATVLPAPKPKGDEKGLILTLLTHGDFGGTSELDWKDGKLSGLKLESACIGKPVREGGWDYKKRAPKPLVSLVPAGSSYFVRVSGDINEAIQRLHGNKIGNRTDSGYGEIAVGLWR